MCYTKSLNVGPPGTLGIATKFDKRWVNKFVTPGKEIQQSPWVQTLKWHLQAIYLAKKKSQLPEDILTAKLDPWHHPQAYGVLVLMNKAKKKETETSALALTYVPSIFGSQIVLLKKKKKEKNDKTGFE